RIFATPAWADGGTLVAAVGAEAADAIALVDISDPGRGRVKGILWRRRGGPAGGPARGGYRPAAPPWAVAGAGGEGVFAVRAGGSRLAPSARPSATWPSLPGADSSSSIPTFRIGSAPRGPRSSPGCRGPTRRPAASSRDSGGVLS